jgi:hypothetical protein
MENRVKSAGSAGINTVEAALKTVKAVVAWSTRGGEVLKVVSGPLKR